MSKENNATVQQKMAQLDDLVAWFDSEDFQLEEAFEKFKHAEELTAEIEKELASMKNEITVLAKRFDQPA